MRREVVFAAEGFSKRFGDNHVLKNAAVHARRGQVTVLLGRNGVGKTTLLRGALGFVPVDNGSVLWRGTATLRPRLASMAREGLFYVPATGLAVPKMRVTKHLQQMRALSSSSVSLKDGDPLEISSFAGARVARLSGGEERRVEVTLGLLRRPRCLIMDEPFKGLAPKHQGLLAQALRRNAETGTAIIVTGHEVERLLSLADEVVWMVAGGTRVLGSPEDALEYPEFARQYLGSRARVSRKAVSRSRPSTEDVSSSEPVRVLGEAPPHSMHRPPWCLRPGLFGRALWTLVAAPRCGDLARRGSNRGWTRSRRRSAHWHRRPIRFRASNLPPLGGDLRVSRVGGAPEDWSRHLAAEPRNRAGERPRDIGPYLFGPGNSQGNVLELTVGLFRAANELGNHPHTCLLAMRVDCL